MKTLFVEILRRSLAFVLWVLYRVEVKGVENFHQAGDRVLIVANHVSFLDGMLLAVYLPKLPMFVVNTYMARNWWVKPFLLLMDYVTIDPANPLYVKSLIRAIERDGPIVIFPEGRITVTGSLMKVYQGPSLVADKAGARILPVHLDGPQYSIFSRLKGVIRQRWFPPVRITILPSRAIEVPDDIRGRERRVKVGHCLEDIMRDMVFYSGRYHQTIFESILQARTIHGGGHNILEDINRKVLSYNGLLRVVFALSGILKKPLSNQHSIGLMLPNAIPLVAGFLSLHLLGKAPAMINYTMGRKGVCSAIRTASIGTIITSRKFIEVCGLERLIEDISQLVEIIYLEDIKQKITLHHKLLALLASWFPLTAWRMSDALKNADEAAVILFTSGSEGEPKGVVLSHENLLANRGQLNAVISFTSDDVMLNAMPLFHSFGLLAGLVLPLVTGIKCFLYPSPLHYNIIPELSYDIRATIVFGTNTFLAGYARKAHPYDFNEARLVIAGAERLQEEVRQLWFDQFGLRILEGYGATETSPVIAINTPIYCKAGTVGRILPGMEYYLIPVEGIRSGGRFVVKGPNVMQGYLMPDEPGVLKPPETDRGKGWYDTGDIVSVDDMDFVTIQGRAKRFAKIAGEMVSLTQVETLAKTCWPDDIHAVVSIPDEKKGEKLVLLTTAREAQRSDLLRVAQEGGANDLMVPRLIYPVNSIPLLGTGKTDYKQILEIAQLELSEKT